MSKEVNIFGYSGHAFVILDAMLASGYEPKGYFDVSPTTFNPYHLTYLGNEREVVLSDFFKHAHGFVCVGDAKVRAKIIEYLEFNHIPSAVIACPSAQISTLTHIMPHTFIGKNACINAIVNIGKGCIINTGAIVEHECQIGDYSHIAPGAVLCGNVKIGKFVHVGANSVLKEGITIANNVIIGAGTVVVKDITEEGSIWVGNPAKRLNR
ncbi:MAG: acetyltransferase [Chitinophagales bacterium]|nr:acetyltransferase [Chitinophagales bacterium]